MSVKKFKNILGIIAIIILLLSLIISHVITVQAFILALAIKFIPAFFLPKPRAKSVSQRRY